jgi:MFS transporter, AAHS family, 4-hydroxybenzoate transporter
MMGIGRFGGIVGSLMVGELLRRKLGVESIFAILAIPGAIAAVALIVKQIAHPEAKQEDKVAGKTYAREALEDA